MLTIVSELNGFNQFNLPKTLGNKLGRAAATAKNMAKTMAITCLNAKIVKLISVI